MKRYKKIISVIIITIICILICGNINCVYGARSNFEQVTLDGGGSSTPSTEQSGVNTIIDTDFYKPTDITGNNSKFINIGNIIIGTMRAVGTVIAVVMLMVIGLKYMMGSVAEKAAYKQTMIPYLVGAVMLFTIPNILGIIYDLVEGIIM